MWSPSFSLTVGTSGGWQTWPVSPSTLPAPTLFLPGQEVALLFIECPLSSLGGGADHPLLARGDPSQPRLALTLARSARVLAWSFSFPCSIFTLRSLGDTQRGGETGLGGGCRGVGPFEHAPTPDLGSPCGTCRRWEVG